MWYSVSLTPRMAPETSLRPRTRRETEGRTDFTAIPVSRGAESLAQRLRIAVIQITAKPEMMLETPIHGGLGGHFMVIWMQFMVIWIHGGL